MHILPIASGKGGVGKSLIAANLAVALAQNGKKVVLADLDLGGSNIHLILGERSIPEGLGTVLGSDQLDLQKLTFKTQYKNLFFIPGDSEIPGVAEVRAGQRKKLIKKLMELEADYLILDLGAGTSLTVLDFFLVSGRGVIVTTPNPTSTLNAYLFLKNLIFRIMQLSFKKGSEADQILKGLYEKGKPLQKIYLPRLMDQIKSKDRESHKKLMEKLEHFHPGVILNMVSTPKEASRIDKLRRSSREYLATDLQHMGVIYQDPVQDIALNSMLPVIIYKPDTLLSQAIFRIADKIEETAFEEGGPLDIDFLEESYQTAALEAKVDFQLKKEKQEKNFCGGNYEKAEMVEILNMLKSENDSLKRENQLLKSKLMKASRQGFDV